MPEQQRPENPYKTACTEEKLKRQMWYGKVYSIRASIMGVRQECDMLHIQIPFEADMECAAIARFGIETESMLEQFYDWFWAVVRSHVKISKSLSEQGVKSAAPIFKADVYNDEDAKHVYIITPVLRPLKDTLAEETDLSSVAGLGIKFGNILRDISAAGIVHGNISLGAFYATENGDVVLGNYFLSKRSTDPVKPYRFFLPPHAPESAISGRQNDTATDVAALCSMLWNMSCSIPVDERIPYRTAPAGIPGEFLSMMQNGLAAAEETSLQSFRKKISDLKRSLAKEEINNPKIKIKTIEITYVERPPEVQAATEEDILIAISSITKEEPT